MKFFFAFRTPVLKQLNVLPASRRWRTQISTLRWQWCWFDYFRWSFLTSLFTLSSSACKYQGFGCSHSLLYFFFLPLTFLHKHNFLTKFIIIFFNSEYLQRVPMNLKEISIVKKKWFYQFQESLIIPLLFLWIIIFICNLQHSILLFLFLWCRVLLCIDRNFFFVIFLFFLFFFA